MRAHSERIGMPSPPERVIATGGASANCKLLELIAQIFGCRVYTAERPGIINSVSLYVCDVSAFSHYSLNRYVNVCLLT